MEEDRWERVRSCIGTQRLELGPIATYDLLDRHLLFSLSRYKFAARLIGEYPKVSILELGCSEGLGALLMAGETHSIVGVDFDKEAIQWARSSMGKKKNTFFKHDNFLGGLYGKFDVVVALDVIEHIPAELEESFLRTIVDNLDADGYCIIGTPNITASQYSSETSRLGHVNLFNAERLRDTMRYYFRNVFLFGMNDEVVHTGFYPMSHYLVVLGCGKR